MPAALRSAWKCCPFLHATSLACAALLWLGGPAQTSALTPPRDATCELGTDSAGVRWRAFLSLDHPPVVEGARRFEIKIKEPLEGLEVFSVIDASDTAWIVDRRGRGVKLKLADGAVEAFQVPNVRQLQGGIASANGALFFGEGGGADGSSIRRWDLKATGTQSLVPLRGSWSILQLVSGRKQVWALLSEGLGEPKLGFELIALDPAGRQVLQRQRREAAWAKERWNVEAVEGTDGAFWMANGYAGRVERFEGVKGWETWELGGRQPSNLVPGSLGAACLLDEVEIRENPELQFMGGGRRVNVLRREIAVFQPGKSGMLKLSRPLDQPSRLSRGPGGVVQVEGQGNLALEGGELRLVPSPPAAK